MLPRLGDGGFHTVGQDDEFGRSAVIIAAKTHYVDLRHSGRKIARKLGKSKGHSIRSSASIAARSSHATPRKRDSSRKAVQTGVLEYRSNCTPPLHNSNSPFTAACLLGLLCFRYISKDIEECIFRYIVFTWDHWHGTPHRGRGWRFCLQARVVRVEPRNGQFGVAVELKSYVFC